MHTRRNTHTNAHHTQTHTKHKTCGARSSYTEQHAAPAGERLRYAFCGRSLFHPYRLAAPPQLIPFIPFFFFARHVRARPLCRRPSRRPSTLPGNRCLATLMTAYADHDPSSSRSSRGSTSGHRDDAVVHGVVLAAQQVEVELLRPARRWRPLEHGPPQPGTQKLN